MRGFILAVAMLAAVPQAHSTERDPDEMLNALYNALFYDLAVSFFCRDELGVTAYQVTRSRMARILGAYIGDVQAIVAVNDLDEQLNNDPRRHRMLPNPSRCHEMKGEARHRVDVERARMELAD